MIMLKLTNAVVEDLITEIIGEDVLPLIRLLKNKKNVSEFKLADSLNITVNQTRNMLYRLHNYSLVTFTRKKDKKKGWYIYYWTLDLKSVKNEVIAFKKKKLGEFKARLDKESEGSYLVCPMGCTRMNMETAMEHNFSCPECNQVLQEQNNQRTIDNLKLRIAEMEEELSGEVREYIGRKTKKKSAKKKTAKKKTAKKKPAKKKAAPKKKPAKKTTPKKNPAKKTSKK